MQDIRPNTSDILQFEKKFRETIYEVQRNAKELDDLKKEHFLIRTELCSKNLLLQNEQKETNELRNRLKLAFETTNRLEEEKMRGNIEYSNLSMNHEYVLKERDILKKEALFYHTEAEKLKLKIESLENALQQEVKQKQNLEQSLIAQKNDNEKIIAHIDMNMMKISKEHKYLIESGKAIIELNGRLQTFGLCFHAINERNKAEIKKLQYKLIAHAINEPKQLSNDVLHPEIEKLCFKLKEMLTELKLKLQDSAQFEEKLNRIFNELSLNLTQIQ